MLRVPPVDLPAGIKNREVLTDYFVRAVAFHSLPALIPAGDVAVWVEHEDRIIPNRVDHELIDPPAVLDGLGEPCVSDRNNGRPFVRSIPRPRWPVGVRMVLGRCH